MSLYHQQIIAIILCALLAFLTIRWYLWGIKTYPLNTSARKKRKKGETIREWFLYTRYREEIPKFFLGLYFVIVFLHAAVLIVWVIQHFVGPYPFFGHCMTVTLIVFDAVWMLLLRLMFWSRDGDMPYERWVPKKRGMPPKQRK
jgi:hypothetical protein